MFAVLILGLVIISQLAIGTAVYLESQRTRKTEQRLFVLVILFTTFWTICNSILAFVDRATESTLKYYIVVNKLAFALSIASLLSIYLFTLFYPLKRRAQLLQKIIISTGLILLLLAPFQLLSGYFTIVAGNVIYTSGSLMIVIGLFVLMTIIEVYSDDARLLRLNNDRQLRRQAKTLLAGLSLTILHAVLFLIVVPIVFQLQQSTTLYVIGYVAPIYFVIFTVYGLLRQGLFDIRALVARAAGYTLSLGIIALTTIVILIVVSREFTRFSVPLMYQQLFFVVTTLLLAIVYQPIKKFFNRITNRLFFRDAYDAQALLNDLNTSLVSVIELNKILQQTALALSNYIKTTHVSFVITNVKKNKVYTYEQQEGRFKKAEVEHMFKNISDKVINVDLIDDEERRKLFLDNDIGLAVKIIAGMHQNEDIGYIILGPKLSGRAFTKQDIRAVEIIADELVIAIQNALRFEEIQQFNITLQDKVDDATRQLRKANDKLIALDQTKDDFISMASHQLRTPLTSVKGYVSMVLEGDVGKITAQQRKLLDQAFLSSQRMVYLIADLLNVSRLKTGKFIIESKPTNLADVIEGELAQLAETATARNLTLKYDKPKHFPIFNLDETKIRQVIMNFVDNAVYYTPPGGHINVDLREDENSIECTVSDDGIGVPKNEQHNLFNKFYRAGNARKARPDGTGLGLFMAKKVVIAQGGAIIFKTEENKGSTFGFKFDKKKVAVESLMNVKKRTVKP